MFNSCRIVSEQSAERFNQSLEQLDSSMKNSVFESIMRLFFRLGDTEYVLCGLDNGQGFSVVIPDLSTWKRNWKLKRAIALPDLTRGQSVVNFVLTIENKVTKTEMEVKFHTEIRWTHRKFKKNPESKLYKDFKWVELSFLEKIGPSQVQKIELIGTGGFGHVYRSKILASGEIVALKVFSSQGSESDRLRFKQEVELQQRLKNPNILRILSSDLSAPSPWFTTPLAQCNLADIISELPGEAKRVSHIFRQVLLGLQYAHEENVIHRDIKPENILVFTNDHVEIGDFGLGKRLSPDTTQTALTQSSENSFGTIAYAAPEQLRSFRDADHRADIYALGKTLFHMLTGKCPPPFYDNLPLDIVGENYRAFIGKCTEEDPENRFQSVQQALIVFNSIK
jgi:hypothetical protein